MTPLRQRMLEDMQVRNLARTTQKSYVQQVTQFARHFQRSPEGLGPEEIRTYQVYLTTERTLAPGSISILDYDPIDDAPAIASWNDRAHLAG